jgi:hypothetical protein
MHTKGQDNKGTWEVEEKRERRRKRKRRQTNAASNDHNRGSIHCPPSL